MNTHRTNHLIRAMRGSYMAYDTGFPYLTERPNLIYKDNDESVLNFIHCAIEKKKLS